jgi:hypothetical protein
VDPEIASGITAATTYGDGTVLLVRGKHAQIYSPVADYAEEPMEFPFSVDAALRLSEGELLLISGTVALSYDVATDSLGDPVELSELGLPFVYVDAADAFDEDRWVVLSGRSYGFLSAEEEDFSFDGPHPVADLCVPERWDRVDAAVNTLDGFLTLSSGREFVEVNLGEGTCSDIGSLSATAPEGPPALEAARLRAPAEMGGLKPPFDARLTGATRVGGEKDLVLLFSGTSACAYSPWTGKELSRFSLDLAVDAAVQLNEESVLLMMGDRIGVFDVGTGEVSMAPLSELGLPEDWDRVDAALELDDQTWMLVRGADALLHTRGVAGPVQSMESLTGVPAWGDRLDAALSLQDGRLLLFRDGELVVIDHETRSASAPLSLVTD